MQGWKAEVQAHQAAGHVRVQSTGNQAGRLGRPAAPRTSAARSLSQSEIWRMWRYMVRSRCTRLLLSLEPWEPLAE